MGRKSAEAAPPRTVLVALCGLSPAVITETVWALAQERPKVIPERVVVLTTAKGREAIRRELFARGSWARLRQCLRVSADLLHFGDTGDGIRLFPAASGTGELEDIASPEDSAAAGDFILDALRQFTENLDTRVVFSVAGGRKTMTALGALAMTLLGRPGDRLCHVLVSPPFDDPLLQPRFCFPDPAVGGYALADGTPVAAAAVQITLCDIPFVRTRRLFAEHLHVLPGTFSRLVERANRSLATQPAAPHIRLDPRTRGCDVDGTAVELSTPEFILLWLLCERARRGEGPVQGQTELSRGLADFDAGITPDTMPEKLHWNSSRREDDDYVRKLASRLRASLRQVYGGEPFWPRLDPAPDRGHYGLRVAGSAIEIAGGA